MNQLNRTPLAGDRVHCPADRGNVPYEGTIAFVGQQVYTNIHGMKYVWCTVRPLPGSPNGGGGVWPSHRLGYNLRGKE